ncbi:MAG: site-specific integrase [Bifidobacterium psychraerophilum]|jgi:integrase|uniref:tyrosine-type recombinase/integrase n=1 Tax=Bifidobacterium psychraerophilum TaxID=218140 RepID=UPI0023F9770C|nr:tyrosine-type recombinase/integrase [Bifidobacterium psychraerophilum]MCI1660910.1 site-specific integrase [Bifidobacterium psychraerophilum]MCI2177347.1 site-specific integrase [Bifidobacterium psychraerophilum]MCI2182912.1 site-specific integrase [Bifidobacterium psychraerophilum]
MASVESYETKAGKRFTVRYRKPDHSMGRKSGFKRKRDAQDYASHVETRISDGDYIDPKGGLTPVAELATRWMKSHRHIWKPSYMSPVQSAWRIHVQPKWGTRAIGSILRSEVQEWVSKLSETHSPSLVLRAFGILKGVFAMAVDDGLIRDAGAVRRIGLPRKPSRKEDRHYLDPIQLVELSDNCGNHRALILTLGFCGIRWGEAAGLRAKDVDLRNQRIHVRRNIVRVNGEYIEGTPKSWEIRDVPIPGKLIPVLAQAKLGLGREDHLFTDEDGHSPRPQSVGKGAHGWWAKALEAQGLELMPPHDLRHTAASIAVSSGANVKALQRMLGHKSAAMTLDTYADLFDSDLDGVAQGISDRIPDLKCA